MDQVALTHCLPPRQSAARMIDINVTAQTDGAVRLLSEDQQVNTYFAPYETGWKDLAQRLPPSITASNPPDRPPTFPFDLYPKNFLLPYHYANPVTGR